MTPVGGSRHYGGSGLGQEGIWGCPSCGEDNTGPIAQGCTHCGAGRPGHRAVPPPAPPAPPAAPPAESHDKRYDQGDIADYWARQHADATIAEAYRMGYLDGVRYARQATQQQQPPPQDVTRTEEFPVQTKAARTIVAALALFRDQVLMHGPEEITSGEWCAVAEVDQLIEQLQHDYEVAHV